jgi:hypothetical protein
MESIGYIGCNGDIGDLVGLTIVFDEDNDTEEEEISDAIWRYVYSLIDCLYSIIAEV